MASINDYFEQSQLSQAAYALNLLPGMTGSNDAKYTLALERGGMSKVQAIEFANTYRVVDQYTDSFPGLSATVFKKQIGVDANQQPIFQQYLAIRGTQTDWGFAADIIVDIAAAFGRVGLFQYEKLQKFYQSLVAVGDIQPESLTVTGHSLGGLLAQMFVVDHSGDVAQTVTFNAPGVGGVGTQILDMAGIVVGNVPAGNVTNVVAEPGWSVTAGLGLMLGDVQNIFIEDSLNQLTNHKIDRLTDSLAVYDAFAREKGTLPF